MITMRAAMITGSMLALVAAILTVIPFDADARSVKVRGNTLLANYPATGADWNHLEDGQASWYGPAFHGKRTASGEIYDQNQMTAAHPYLPFGTSVRVINLENSRSVVLRVNDRGPFKPGRVIDVSYRAGQELAMIGRGLTQVRVETNGEALAATRPAPIAAEQRPTPRAATQPCGPYATHYPAPSTLPYPPQTATYNPAPAPAYAPRPALAPLPPLTPSQIFVQVGAYERQANAQLVNENLRELAPTKVDAVPHYDGRTLYRVRLGPFETAARADEVREMADEAGFPDSKVIME